MKAWQYGLIALLLGALMPLAYAPYHLYPLSLLSLSGLFYLWSKSSPGRAFLYGFLFGLAMFGAGVNWVFISIHEYGYVPLGLSILLTLLFVAVLALFPALCGYIAGLINRQQVNASRVSVGLFILWGLPSLWMLFEWLRGWFLTGFPWLHIGYAFIDTPLAGYAPLLGVYGVSLIAAVSSALLLQMLIHQPGKINGRYLLIIMLVWGCGGLLYKIDWTQQVGQTLRVSLVQGNIPQEMKWLAGMKEPTLQRYAGLTREHWDSDIVIWPETAIPMFSYQAYEFLDAMKAEAILNDTELLVGLVYQDPVTAAYYNSMVGLGIEGGRYDKQHLVPFTEYLPFKTLLAGVIDILDVPMSDFSSGGIDQQPLRLAGQPLGISICFEDAFGEEVIRSLPVATLLVNVSNDAWFAGSIAPEQHLQMARMRALESQRELMRATNTGVSAFIAANGKVKQQAPQFATEVLTHDVQPRSGATPYVYLGNVPALIGASVLLVAVFFTRRKQ